MEVELCTAGDDLSIDLHTQEEVHVYHAYNMHVDDVLHTRTCTCYCTVVYIVLQNLPVQAKC